MKLYRGVSTFSPAGDIRRRAIQPLRWGKLLNLARRKLHSFFNLPIYLGRAPKDGRTALILFPYSANTLCCGLCGLISIQHKMPLGPISDLNELEELVQVVESNPLGKSLQEPGRLAASYLSGVEVLTRLETLTCSLKRETNFLKIFHNKHLAVQAGQLADRLSETLNRESAELEKHMGHMAATDGELTDRYIEKLKDIHWCLKSELIGNIDKIAHLMARISRPVTDECIKIFRNINAVLNSIDRLEVRGRDSAGISLLFVLAQSEYSELHNALEQNELADQFNQRADQPVLLNGAISAHQHPGQPGEDLVGITVTYKVAAEIGRLGDNVSRLRDQIGHDAILHYLARLPHRFHTVSAHTRWASVGAITVPNCHPMDNITNGPLSNRKGIVHACLNGDIDNYLQLKQQWEAEGEIIPQEISTDTKIIPLQIEKYLRKGHSVEESFRLAVNDFEGSHAIAMHTDLAPGKFFLAQKGSGQAVFVGLADDYYIPTSEVYGFVEETSDYIKLNGEKIVQGPDGPVQGQIFILDQNSKGRLDGIKALFYDGSPVELGEQQVQHTQITSRDIDRQDFPHYFLKEISEAPRSVAKTLQNRCKASPNRPDQLVIALEPSAFPDLIAKALMNDQIRRIFFIGQGTAGVAALAIADILNFYLNDPSVKVSALKASELSGFQLGEQGGPDSMADTLVVAISQSGTTTDTNRAVDMVRARGAFTMAIVNRRDSDITFKVNGVVYTSSGRDIEMSVASTKAFYSQIVAGALVSLKIAQIKSRRSQHFISEELKSLLALPDQMRRVLALGEQIRESAQRLAPAKTYWAAVGSGPNKAAADEIRIKLSELCYKTISSDYVEDKKHIDLSSEPLIIVCAAGAPATVIGDIIKDTAIFKAHKASPVIIADEGETRFAPYAEDIFHLPAVQPHLAPILNTLAGHLWGYYAALAINNGSLFLHTFREDIQNTVDQYAQNGLDVYELVLEKSFREKMAQFYAEFRRRQAAGQLPSTISHSADMLLLLKYLTGRLPVSDFELDFGRKGTALNMLNSLFEFLGHSINGMSRPVDAIKHQAKTVTVGTSRISERIEGILFEALEQHDISSAQLINRNILVLKNLQAVVGAINGSILYRIDGLNLLGEPTDQTTIEILCKEGLLKALPSRVEADHSLKGTKRIIVRQGNVYIGKGRKDGRSILVIPAISTKPDVMNRIEYLLLLNISFRENIPLPDKVKALGGKYEHIKNIVQENSLTWEDKHLELVPVEDLFGHSAEKIGESIVKQLSNHKAV